VWVRRVTDEDVADVVELAWAFWSESPLHRDFPFDAVKVEGLIRNALAADDSWLALIVVDDDRIVGMALVFAMHMFFGPAIEVGDLAFYVRPDARGGRAALLLEREIASWAALVGASKVSIGIHTGINHDPARRFFEKRGYGLTGLMLSKSVH
jgi:GNAT superfamily N-acetyltransferase